MIYLLLSITLISWASAFVGIKYLLNIYSPQEIAFLRFFFASIFFLFIALYYKVRLPTRKFFLILLSGFFGITVYNIALNYAELIISSAESSFIINLAPIFMSFFAFAILKESIETKILVSLALSMTGVTLMSYSKIDGLQFNMGILFAIVASISHALYFTIQKKLLNIYTPIEVASYSIWIGFILMIPFNFNTIASLNTILSTEYNYLTILLYLSIFPSTLAYFFWIKVLSIKKVSNISIFLYFIPIITLILGYIFLKEIPSLISIAGGILILISLFIANTKKYNLRKKL
jgi:drug/metabolite transporter (DMT)-like permease